MKRKEPWLVDDPLPSEEELQAAQELGRALDEVLAGQEPAAENELLNTARMVHSAFHEEPPSPQRTRDVVERALEQAVEQAYIKRRGGGLRRAAPLLAVAASLILVVAGLTLGTYNLRPDLPQVRPLPPQVLSRPSDDLLGRPIQDRAGASGRLDLVFADRLNGYRAVILAHSQPQELP